MPGSSVVVLRAEQRCEAGDVELVRALRRRSAALFAFAGLWRHHVGPIKKDGPHVELDVFSFMTTTPNALVETVNHERMPVLLATPGMQDQWVVTRKPSRCVGHIHQR